MILRFDAICDSCHLRIQEPVSVFEDGHIFHASCHHAPIPLSGEVADLQEENERLLNQIAGLEGRVEDLQAELQQHPSMLKIQDGFEVWLLKRLKNPSWQEDLVKLMEECGELAQILKRWQSEGRMSRGDAMPKLREEVADIAFCLMSVCNNIRAVPGGYSIDFYQAIASKWESMKDRPIPEGFKKGE